MFVQGEQLAAGPPRRHLVATPGTHTAHILAKLREHLQPAEVAPAEGGVYAALPEVGGAKEFQPASARARTHAHTRGEFELPLDIKAKRGHGKSCFS